MKRSRIFIAGFILWAFAIVGVGLVAITQAMTVDRIAVNEREALLSKLRAIIPAVPIENDPLSDVIEVSAPELLGGATTRVYRVVSAGEPVAVILDPKVPDGYAGPIRLLVSVLADGRLGGVRVVSHHETPGLGDKIEERKSDWVHDFAGRSLGDPAPELWAVKRDGGIFDQFTGATITPRSIVRAVKKTLDYVDAEAEHLFAMISDDEPPAPPKDASGESMSDEAAGSPQPAIPASSADEDGGLEHEILDEPASAPRDAAAEPAPYPIPEPFEAEREPAEGPAQKEPASPTQEPATDPPGHPTAEPIDTDRESEGAGGPVQQGQASALRDDAAEPPAQPPTIASQEPIASDPIPPAEPALETPVSAPISSDQPEPETPISATGPETD
ncbi:electron transport complex subunit RsxG [Thioalkalicoccus limnaeus]|uniref:Ion-translocating oxidoreductase complex subunit G n=1 Tax=Thioalkalicoccus limnaeus TaxID=120681 RepID=A0ABV4BFV0_9GAMM